MWRKRYTAFSDNDFAMLDSADSIISNMFWKMGPDLENIGKIAMIFRSGAGIKKNYDID